MTAILVAGATGEVGRAVLALLTARGAQVRTRVRSTPLTDPA